MKIKDLFTSGSGVFHHLNFYMHFKLETITQKSNLPAFGLFIWAIMFIVMTTKIINLTGYESPLLKLQESIDKQDQLYFIAVKQEKLVIEKLFPDYPEGTRPIFNRLEIVTPKNFCEKNARLQKQFFFTFGLKKKWSLCQSLKKNSEHSTEDPVIYFISDSKEDLDAEIKNIKNDQRTIAGLSRGNTDIRELTYSETTLGFGFVRLVFDHISVGTLGNNDAFLLVFLITVAFCCIFTFHLSAYVFQAPNRLSKAIDLGVRNLAIWIILLGTINIIGCLPYPKEMENRFIVNAILFPVAFVFVLPSLIAWKNSYKLSWPRLFGILLLCIPASLLPGVLIFSPIGYVSIVYNDILAIFI